MVRINPFCDLCGEYMNEWVEFNYTYRAKNSRIKIKEKKTITICSKCEDALFTSIMNVRKANARMKEGV